MNLFQTKKSKMNINEKLFNQFRDRLKDVDQDEEIGLSFLALISQRAIVHWIDDYIERMFEKVLNLFPEVDEKSHRIFLTAHALSCVYGGPNTNGCEISHQEIVDLVEIYWDQNIENNTDKST